MSQLDIAGVGGGIVGLAAALTLSERFPRDLQRLVPELRDEDLSPGGSGVRAQAIKRDGQLVADFAIEEVAYAMHALNAPSSASPAIPGHSAQLAARNFDLKS